MKGSCKHINTKTIPHEMHGVALKKKKCADCGQCTIAKTRDPEEIILRLEAAADFNGMWAIDVAKHPELIAPFGIAPRRLTPELIERAHQRALRLTRGIVQRAERRNESMLKDIDDSSVTDADLFNQTLKRRNKTMAKTKRISQDNAVAILIALGIKTAGKYSAERLEKKLAEIGSITDAKLEKIEDAKMQKRVTGLRDYAAEGNVVALKPAEAAEEEADGEGEDTKESKSSKSKETKAGKGKEKKSKKTPQQKAAAKGEKKPKKAKPRDGWGNGIGTGASMINLAIPAKGIFQVNDIAETTGLPATRVRDHLRTLLKVKEVITKTDKGYAMAKGAYKTLMNKDAKAASA